MATAANTTPAQAAGVPTERSTPAVMTTTHMPRLVSANIESKTQHAEDVVSAEEMIIAQRAKEDQKNERDQHALLRRPGERAGPRRQEAPRVSALMRTCLAAATTPRRR